MQDYIPWQHNPAGDPDYIWHSHRNEAGEMVYAIPQECPNNIPTDTTEGALQFNYMNLKLFGTKKVRVFWTETTNRELAEDQKSWLDAEAKRIERRKKREFPVAEVRMADDDGNRKKSWNLLDDLDEDFMPESDITDDLSEYDIQYLTDEDPDADSWYIDDNLEEDEDSEAPDWGINEADKEDNAEKLEPVSNKRKEAKDFREPYKFPATEHHALILAELEDVRKYITERHPRWWQALYLKKMWGATAEEIAAELGINPSRVYQIISSAEKLAREFREKNN